eukprot:1895576-Pleurochrysis_carterae.AAC.1
MWPARPSTVGPDGAAEHPCPRLVVESAHTPAIQACNPASAPPTSAMATVPARIPGTEPVLGLAGNGCQSIVLAHPGAWDCRERAQPSRQSPHCEW